MNVMHLLASANMGGIESLCRDYARFSFNKNIFVALWGKDGACASSINMAQGIAIELDSTKKQVLVVLKKLFKLVEKYSIDVVVVHHAAPIMHIYMHLLKMKNSRIKTVAYAHGMAEDMYRHRDFNGSLLRKIILAYSLKKSDRVVAISNSVKKSLVSEFRTPSNKIVVIYNGTNIKKYDYNAIEHNDRINRFIYVGRLIKEKGVQITIKALSKIPSNINWTLDIVGDGVYRKELEDLVRSFLLDNKIKFLGKRNDIPDLLKQHDVFIHMPEWEEGFGITIIEAMASGLLCICKVSGGIPEIIDNGVNGILVKDEEELTNTLTSVLTKTANYPISTLRKNAINRAKVFDIKEYSRCLDETINNLK